MNIILDPKINFDDASGVSKILYFFARPMTLSICIRFDAIRLSFITSWASSWDLPFNIVGVLTNTS